MKTIKFNKTDCGVDFLINVLFDNTADSKYLLPYVYNTDFFEVIVFKKGKGRLFLDDEAITIKDNTIVFISPFQRKKWEMDFSYTTYFTTLVFQEDFLNEFFSDKLFTYRLLYFYQTSYPHHLYSDEKQIESICAIFWEMKSELISPNLDSVHIIRSLIYYLLQRLSRTYGIVYNLPYGVDNDNYAYLFKKLMEVHIREKHKVSDYCKMIRVSRITLNTAVKKQFNVTATDLLKNRLLTEIKTELIYSDKTITEVAYDFGYTEPSHMMRFFKRQTGLTPSEFLKAYQKGSY